ncbi:MAG: type I-E CRISPR-associated protein Cas7/Cse4/CasC [Clostridiales bacterium]|nr:type I-E CRISPR-associated protein Cas7/Cse4/CasC [Clostridiales bacterium]MDO4349424.1 type I-E CRISPR-associated protein Cas7/Cse4/CasC [Eubacteriales bacterium]MDY4008571.1 type I-E CRISPR-associated protein Cas7/Cse4/CasC [Candidatus Limiplasma sp.]
MKTNERLYIDFHVLQTVPPSCVNRDDTGAPKTAVYGGATRARVSSQAWKRAIRMMFTERLPEEQVGKRTKNVLGLLAETIAARDASVNAEKLARDTLKDAGLTGKGKDEDKTSALFFISRAQLDALAGLAIAGEKDKEKLKAALNAAPALDIALFGRMVASDPELNMDAACQVAHAISTHTVHNEYDYFTAVDDCAPQDNAGAGHLGTVEYNSATLYRYATINIGELREKGLGMDIPSAVRVFADAFIHAMPTGKQNTFANRTMPDFVYAALRTDQPVNLAGAFEQPIPASQEGYARRSVERLTAYAGRVYESFAEAPAAAYAASMVEMDSGFAAVMPVAKLLDALERDVAARLRDDEVM